MFPRGKDRSLVCPSGARLLLRRLGVPKGLLVLGCLALSLQSACASHEFVELPVRGADVYPFAEIKYGVAVAIDEISDPSRVRRYFGTDLIREGILPVEVILSNHGRHRVKIGPADILLLRGAEVIDPLPVEKVADLPKSEGLWTLEKTGAQIDNLFDELVLKETVVARGETVRGVIFFKAAERPIARSQYFTVVSLFPQPRLQLHLVITDLEDQERIRFGPFSLYTRTSS